MLQALIVSSFNLVVPNNLILTIQLLETFEDQNLRKFKLLT